MNIGKIKFYNSDKSYGFIVNSEEQDVFFHVSGQVNPTTLLKKGDKVSYEITHGNKGIQATKINKIKRKRI